MTIKSHSERVAFQRIPDLHAGPGFLLRKNGSVNDRFGAADSHYSSSELFPGTAAADAVGGKPHRTLECFQRVLGVGAEDAVQCAGGISKGVLFLSITTTKNHQKIGGPWMVPR